MSKYIVDVPEVWYQAVAIEAGSSEEAISKVEDGEGEYLDNELRYSQTLQSDEATWRVMKDE